MKTSFMLDAKELRGYDVVPMGEAAGYAAALCSQEKTDPPQIDGTRVKAYMAGIGYEL